MEAGAGGAVVDVHQPEFLAGEDAEDELRAHVDVFVQRLSSYPDWPEMLEMTDCPLCEVPAQDRPLDPEQEP